MAAADREMHRAVVFYPNHWKYFTAFKGVSHIRLISLRERAVIFA
jgi:hypothetical protein